MNRSNRKLRRAIVGWLAHERAGGEPAAERALAGVFAALPRLVPDAGFARRVLERAGLHRRGSDLQGARVRGLVAVCASLAACALLFAPALAGALGATLRPALLVRLTAGALAAGIQRLAAGVTVWETLARIAQAVGSALSSPPMLMTLTLCALVSVAAFRLLQGLMVSERSS